MNCHLILDRCTRGWVIEKMCRKLRDELLALGCDVSVGESVNMAADINHFMLFLTMPSEKLSLATVAITHVDDRERLNLARAAVRGTELAICVSSMTVKQLVNAGIDRNKLCYVLPALDEGMVPRRIVIGICSRLYSDGRKREQLLECLANEIDLSAFHFEIFGIGWDRVAATLRKAGAVVTLCEETEDAQEDYRRIRERVPFFDYYLYLGLDEGSLGTLEALAAGVKTIITPQGFHVDLPAGITHAFVEYEELRAIFERIRDERDNRVRTVRNLTWRNYAKNHLLIWRTLLEGRREELPRLLGQESLDPLGGYSEKYGQHMAREQRMQFFRSLRRSYFPGLQSRIGRHIPELFRRYLRRRWS